jgi:HEAT repeat protein
VALQTGDPVALGRALESVGEDRALEVQLLFALGKTHDPRALDPLIVHLGAVRTRVETVAALVELGDARAVPFLARWIGGDPYIPVRAAMAGALGKLGRDEQTRATARAALQALIAVETEQPVLAAARDALTSLR